MGFLYGDSTPSPLEYNFLEFLRDALDFSVVALQADSNIERIRARKVASAHAADEETERLQAFGRVVLDAIDGAPKGDEDSETSRCAASLVAAAVEAVSASTDAVQRTLDAEVAQADADEAAQREASFKALEVLLLAHEVPEAKVTRRLDRQPDGSYRATLHGSAVLGLDWRVGLAIPEGHALAGLSPMERLAPQLEFHAPEQTGWIKKEVKPRPQKMDRFALIEASDDGAEVVLKVRATGGETGFDFRVLVASSSVGAAKTGTDVDGPFELATEDAPKLISLAQKLREALAGLGGGRLEEATFDSGTFKLHPTFRDLVERLTRQMAPVVQEISRHSLTRTELVIRRLLSNERREEIFVTKKALREKYGPLPADQRKLFDGFGFDTLPPPPAVPGPEADPQPVEAQTLEPAQSLPEPSAPAPLRTEVKPSQPPPPPSWVRPAKGAGSPPAGPTWRKPPPRSESE